MIPAEYQARLDQLAADTCRAADQHGVPSPEHDTTMDAWAQAAETYAPEQEAEAS